MWQLKQSKIYGTILDQQSVGFWSSQAATSIQLYEHID